MTGVRGNGGLALTGVRGNGGSASSGPFGSASQRSHRPLRRGLISCLHSHTCLHNVAPTGGDEEARTGGDVERPLPDQDLPRAIIKLIVPFYEKAFDRLPCETMPDLVGLLTTGGFCLGLLDPVSNITLNTLALLPEDAAAAASFSPPAGKRSKRVVRNAFPISKRGLCAWHEVAARSYHSLVGFLVAYFGCLTEEQAIRYLYRANANLLLAVMLVQHDLYAEDLHAEGEEPLDPDSDRTRAALESAATSAGHPSPSTLAQVMTIRLKDDDFKLLEYLFSADGTPIMAKDAGAIHHIVMSPLYVTGTSHAIDELAFHVDLAMEAKTEVIPDTSITCTTYSFHSKPIWSMQSGLSKKKLKDCLKTAARQAILLKTPCGDNCDYLRTLNMYLHGMIHNFYIKALKLLPTPSGSLMRSFLTAGHCYGSMDPVSNIIVNSIWYYSRGSSLPLSERRKIDQYIDIFDPVALLPAQVFSLEGLTKLATFVHPQFSVVGCALETLCRAKCNFVEMFTSTTERIEISSIHEAAMAAGHPLPLQLGELHQKLVLMPDERNMLLSLIAGAQTSNTVLPVNEITTFLEAVLCTEPVLGKAPELTSKAARMVSNMRSDYEEKRSWFRSQIEKVLKDYTLKHFWGPKYKLDIILGVEKSWEGLHSRSGRHYCVNFTATSDFKLARELFFAQFWVSSERKPSICCRLPYPYVAHCYFGGTTSRKIVYPDRSEYIRVDITIYGTHRVYYTLERDLVYFSPRTILEMDLVYFCPKTDVKLAEYLNHVARLPEVPGHTFGRAGLKQGGCSKIRPRPGQARPSVRRF